MIYCLFMQESLLRSDIIKKYKQNIVFFCRLQLQLIFTKNRLSKNRSSKAELG